MSFYIDHFRWVKAPGAEPDILQLEYSQQECIDLGWFDPETHKWLRKTVTAPDSDGEFPECPYPDPNYNEKLI